MNYKRTQLSKKRNLTNFQNVPIVFQKTMV